MIYVTHDQVEAMSMGDRVILMQKGRIVQDGTPAELYDRPATSFVAGFIGSPAMNLVKLAAAADGAVIEGEPRCNVAPHAAKGHWLGVRPEDIRLLSPDATGVPAKVVDAEYLGADTIVQVRVGEQQLRVRFDGKPNVVAGAECRLQWRCQAAHFFAADDGQRLTIVGHELVPDSEARVSPNLARIDSPGVNR